MFLTVYICMRVLIINRLYLLAVNDSVQCPNNCGKAYKRLLYNLIITAFVICMRESTSVIMRLKNV